MTISILLVLLIASAIKCQQEQEVTLDRPSDNTTLHDNEVVYYSVTIPSEIMSKAFYLIFDAFSTAGDLSDPDIFISSVLPIHL